jgi:2-phosphosulfolactate phosphatase
MLHVHFIPTLTTPQELAGGFVIVIDVLRASTTICYALAAGAKAVIPCLEVDEAQRFAQRHGPGAVLLGGERGGLPIAGFDLGNSPGEYTAERVGGRTIAFTTTNGTKAMQLCGEAERVTIGAFVNLSAVCRGVLHALNAGRTAHLLCAGTGGEITAEDVLLAGAVAQQITRTIAVGNPPESAALADSARLAALAWRSLCAELKEGCGDVLSSDISATALGDYLIRHTRGGRNLATLGLTADTIEAAGIDRFDFAPELLLREWRVVRSAE